MQHSWNSLGCSGLCWALAAQQMSRIFLNFRSHGSSHSPVWVQVVSTEILSFLCAWVAHHLWGFGSCTPTAGFIFVVGLFVVAMSF